MKCHKNEENIGQIDRTAKQAIIGKTAKKNISSGKPDY